MGFFKKDPTKRIRKRIDDKLLEARNAQRAGKIQRYADLMQQVDQLTRELEDAQAGRAS